MIKVTDKRRDGAGAISISGKELGDRAAEDSREDDGSQDLFFHLGLMPLERRENGTKKRRG